MSLNGLSMNKLRWLTIVATLAMASLAQAAQPSLFDNHYSAKLYGFNINVESRLTALPDNHYDLYFDAETLLGSVTETSHLRWDEQRQVAIPLDYTYERTGMGKNRHDVLRFDWQDHLVFNVLENRTWSFDPAKQIQDNLTYQLQLRQDLIAGKTHFVYPLVDRKKVKDYQFEIVGEEVLDTPLGKVATVKIKRAQTNDKRETYAWFAKDFQYLLVRLQQEENGSAYTIYISKASLNGKAIAHF